MVSPPEVAVNVLKPACQFHRMGRLAGGCGQGATYVPVCTAGGSSTSNNLSTPPESSVASTFTFLFGACF